MFMTVVHVMRTWYMCMVVVHENVVHVHDYMYVVHVRIMLLVYMIMVHVQETHA